MNVAIFTSSSLRHKAFAAIAHSSDKLNIVAIFYEDGNPLKDLIDHRSNSNLERLHLASRDQAETDFFELY